jgi:hypothetical protein
MSLDAWVDWAQSIQDTPFGTALAESPVAFPVIEGLHLIGLSISVGLLFLVDLRLLGWLLVDVPATRVLRALRPWSLAGFALVFVTGGLLFWAEAATLVASPAFPFKLLFIALAGANAAYFEVVIARRPSLELGGVAPPRAARAAGAASLLLWSAVIVCGRLIPYVTHW